MTDLPPPPPGFDAPSPTVVVDTNATVKKSRGGVIAAVVVVVALVAGFVVWFVMAGDDDYTPGPEAEAVVAGLKEADIEVALSNGELKCIDEVFAGVDLADLDGAYDPFGGDLTDDVMDRSAKLLDDCVADETRIDLIDQSMAASDLGNAEQRACAAPKFDAMIAENGGYAAVMNDEVDISDQTLAVFDDCGIDLFGGLDDADSNACETELRTIETAIEAYNADTGTDATSYDDLVPTYLLEDPSERFEFVLDSSGVPYVVGVGECEGY